MQVKTLQWHSSNPAVRLMAAQGLQYSGAHTAVFRMYVHTQTRRSQHFQDTAMTYKQWNGDCLQLGRLQHLHCLLAGSRTLIDGDKAQAIGSCGDDYTASSHLIVGMRK
eukprot:745005-Pelagomonas_calceolata.AAC.2